MNSEVLAIAIIKPNDGKESEVLETLRALYAALSAKQYSRDQLFRDASQPSCFFNLRYWASDEKRMEAMEDPDVHKHWMRLGTICTVEKVYEKLHELPTGV